MTMLELMWQDAIAIARRTGGRPGGLPKMPTENAVRKRPAPNKIGRAAAIASVVRAVAAGDRLVRQVEKRTGYTRDYCHQVASAAVHDGLLSAVTAPGTASVYSITDAGRAWLEVQG